MNQFKFCLFLFLVSINFYSQNDCRNFITICGNSNISDLTATGAGSVEDFKEITRCKLPEYNTLWLKVDIKKGGTLGFTLTPESSELYIDFDFYVFGPNVSCNNVGNPIRYSLTNPLAANLLTNATGMNNSTSNIYFGGLGSKDDCSDLGTNGSGFVKWLDTNDNESYFIVISRYSGDTKFSIEWTGTATFDDPPSLNIPSANALDIEKPDFSGDLVPSVNFDLTVNTPTVIGSQTGVEVTYHTSANDAIINANPIIDPANFKNTTNPQTVYIRITNAATQCYNTTSFDLIVNDKFIFPTDKFETCDYGDANPNDGKTKINLDQVATTIFKKQDISDLNFDYYLTKNDADNNTNKLVNFFYNTIPFQQSLFVVVSNIQYKIATQEIKININPLPLVTNTNLVQCDSGINANGLVLFNLKEVNSSLTNNNSDLETSFFLNNSDALNNTNVLPTDYTNISNPQTLFVRITNSKTKCYSISNLTLKTNVIPETTYSVNPVCDDDGIEDGLHLIDITQSNIPITIGQNIKYYITENDALLEQNQIEIPDSYSNQIAYNQTIFARIEAGNDCFAISKIKLEVSKLPQLETTATTTVCYNDLTYFAHLDSGINNTNTNDFSYLWKKDGIELPNETSPTLNVNTIGAYTVTVTNNAKCSKTRTIEVTYSSIATIESIAIIDLQTNDSNTITVYSSGQGNYQYSLDFANGLYQDSNVFTNVSAGIHNVFVKDTNGCGTVTKTSAVVGALKFFTPNNDGFNDYWNIQGLNSQFYANSTIYIYNRYGKLLTKVNPLSKGWDGSFDGSILPSDDYWFTLKVEDGREAKGHFSLKR